jgi:hypothetical protein
MLRQLLLQLPSAATEHGNVEMLACCGLAKTDHFELQIHLNEQ